MQVIGKSPGVDRPRPRRRRRRRPRSRRRLPLRPGYESRDRALVAVLSHTGVAVVAVRPGRREAAGGTGEVPTGDAEAPVARSAIPGRQVAMQGRYLAGPIAAGLHEIPALAAHSV